MFKLKVKEMIEVIILAVMVIGISSLYMTEKMELLVNPKFDGFMVISIFIISLFIFNRIKNFRRSSASGNSVLQKKYIPFLFMIVLAVVPSYTQFQSNISKVKGLQLGETTAYQSEDVVSQEDEDDGKDPENLMPGTEGKFTQNSEGKEIEITDKDFISKVNLIYEHPEQYSGVDVTLKGFVYRIRSHKKNPKIFGISRMAMYCCAAHSVPVGLICKCGVIKEPFSDNKWYQVKGKLKYEKVKIRKKLQKLPVLYLYESSRIKNPGSPYVYPYYK